MNTASAGVAPLTRPTLTVPPWAWLLVGIPAVALLGMRYNVALLGWVGAVPFLLYLRKTQGWKSRLLLAGVLQLATFLSILRIVTEPLPWFFALMFSVPMALSAALTYTGFEALRRRLGDRWGLALFPAMTISLEWLSANTSSMGSWGALAYTQIDNPALMQVTALVGMAGVSVLLAATSAWLAVVIDRGLQGWKRSGAGLALLVLGAVVYGSVRLHSPVPGETVTVATVVSDVGLTPEGLPSRELLDAAEDTLFATSTEATTQGAEIVVWNEGALAIQPDAEDRILARGQDWANTNQADLVMAYVVPLDGMVRFENKYVWMTPSGPLESYLKHHPVPGEGSVAGTAPLAAFDRPYGRAAGAICYDYDFPSMGRKHAQLGIDLAVVPSSDWAGIDPYHTQMASIRGIEGGYAVVRSVRAATSAVFDAHGVIRGRASDLEGEKLLVADVPVGRIETVYSRVGDVLPAGGGLVVLAGLCAVPLGARRRRGQTLV